MQKLFFSISFISLFTITAYSQKISSYPVVVSFNSMCCGVPNSRPVMKLVNNFKKQYKIKRIVVDSIGPMGREGEYYLAFRLKEMTHAQKIKFIERLKKMAPTMIDKGSAEIKENVVINKSDLSSRTGITTLRL